MPITKQQRIIIASVIKKHFPQVSNKDLKMLKLAKEDIKEINQLAQTQQLGQKKLSNANAKSVITHISKLLNPSSDKEIETLIFYIREDLDCRTAAAQFITFINPINEKITLAYFFDAVKYGTKQEVEIFLEKNRKFIDKKNEIGLTPLDVACTRAFRKDDNKNIIEILRTLCKYGADVNAINGIGHPVLFWSFYLLNKEISAFLIGQKATIDLKLSEDDSRSVSVVESLLHPPEIIDEEIVPDLAKTILDFNERLKFAEWLGNNYKNKFKINTYATPEHDFIYAAIQHKNFKALELLHKLNADFNKILEINGAKQCYMVASLAVHFGRDMYSSTSKEYPEDSYQICQKLIDYGYSPKQHTIELDDKRDPTKTLMTVDNYVMYFLKIPRLMEIISKNENIQIVRINNQDMTFWGGRKIENTDRFATDIAPYLELCNYFERANINISSVPVPEWQLSLLLCNSFFINGKSSPQISQLAEQNTIIQSSDTQIIKSKTLINNPELIANTTTITIPSQIPEDKEPLINSILTNIISISELIKKSKLDTHIPKWVDELNTNTLKSATYSALETLNENVANWTYKTKNRLLASITSTVATEADSPQTSNTNLQPTAIYEKSFNYIPELMIKLRGNNNICLLRPFNDEKIGIESIVNADKINSEDLLKLKNMFQDLSKLKLEDDIVKFYNVNAKCRAEVNGILQIYSLFGELKIPHSENRIALFALSKEGQGPKLLVMGAYVEKGFHDSRFNNHIFQCGRLDFSEKRIDEVKAFYTTKKAKLEDLNKTADHKVNDTPTFKMR